MLSQEEFMAQLEALKDALFRFARRNLNVISEVDDVFSEAVLSAWKQRDQFQTGTSFRAWMFRILLNKIYVANRRRALEKKAVQDPRLQRDETVETEPNYDVFNERLGDCLEQCEDDLREAILRLNEKEREAFLLLSLGELSYAEIAAATDAPEGTVITRLTRARAKLREALRSRPENVDKVRTSS